MADPEEKVVRRRSIRKASQNSYLTSKNAQKELREKVKKVTEILKKPEHERSSSDKAMVFKNPEVVKTSQKNARRLQANKDRLLEIEDEPLVYVQKCEELAELIKSSKRVVVYTGAGISTAASIPDYRGPNGVWTMLKKGHELSPQDLSDAEPTFTHMSLSTLYKIGKVKHIVSQNCDGLHLRSGYPQHALSEVHGNMYIECCYNCAPHKEYVRLFDVTERTGVHRHNTSRRCRSCGVNLKDTIVHFGEKGKLKSPYRWKEAVRAAKNADLILCLGSSLKVLKKYACLWCMEMKPLDRPKLVVVNLQWTPKDDVAALKINGKCDEVMMKVMNLLNLSVPQYERKLDPIFKLCTPLRANELKTTSKKILIPPPELQKVSRRSKKTKIDPSSQLERTSQKSLESGDHEFLPPVSCKAQSDNENFTYTSLNYASILTMEFGNQDKSKQDEFKSAITDSSLVETPSRGITSLPKELFDNTGRDSCNIVDLESSSDMKVGFGTPVSYSTTRPDVSLLNTSNPHGFSSTCSKQKYSCDSEKSLPTPTEKVQLTCKNNFNNVLDDLSKSYEAKGVSNGSLWNGMSVVKESVADNVPQLVIVDLGKVAANIGVSRHEQDYFLNSFTDLAALNMQFLSKERSFQLKRDDLAKHSPITSSLPQDFICDSVDVYSQSGNQSINLDCFKFLPEDKAMHTDADSYHQSQEAQLKMCAQPHPKKCHSISLTKRLNVDTHANMHPKQNTEKHLYIQEDHAIANLELASLEFACSLLHSGKGSSSCHDPHFSGPSPLQSMKDQVYPLQLVAVLPQLPTDISESQRLFKEHSNKTGDSYSVSRNTEKHISLDHCYTQKEDINKKNFKILGTPDVIKSGIHSIKAHLDFNSKDSVACNMQTRQIGVPQTLDKCRVAMDGNTAMACSINDLSIQIDNGEIASKEDVIPKELPSVTQCHMQEFYDYTPKNVPSCILNMDDMETIYKLPNSRLEETNNINVKSNPNNSLFPKQSEVLLMEVDSLKASENKDMRSHQQVVTDRTKGLNTSVDNYFGKEPGAEVKDDSKVNIVTVKEHHPLLNCQTVEQEIVKGMSNSNCFTTRKPGVHDKNAVLKSQLCGEIIKGPQSQINTKVAGKTAVTNDRKKEISNTHDKICKEGRENVCKRTVKHKVTPSVPGWFGKGLAIKRKKK